MFDVETEAAPSRSVSWSVDHRTTADKLTKPQAERWEQLKALCLRNEARASEDPLVFHGTTAMRAALIARDGFRMTDASTGEGIDAVHWGDVGWATWGAERNMEADDAPAIIVARLSAVLASGKACPDFNALEVHDREERKAYDWRRSLDEVGAITVLEGRRVEGMTVLGLGDLPYHPRAPEVRAKRIELNARSGWDIGPHLAHEIPPGHEITSDTVLAPDSDVDLNACGVYGEDAQRRLDDEFRRQCENFRRM